MSSIYDFMGCCGADIIYGFSQKPDAILRYKIDPETRDYTKDKNGKRIPITHLEGFKEGFKKRAGCYPNRMYCAILNDEQFALDDMAWPKILKEMGFEFVRSWSNSNHDGSINSTKESTTPHPLYLFVLCTDEKGTYKDHNRPPPKWCEL